MAVGLEWLYRLAREPRRLWRRYLHSNARFLLANIRHRPSMMVADW
jgi:N-acetylglucosaminyldiphosphoundecaprenol N-acetyl-beta-D-mannosaminyltransferase